MQQTRSVFEKGPVLVSVAVLCTLLWGGAFPAIKIGYETLAIGSGDTFSQILFAGVRFTLAGILAWCIGSIAAKRPLLPHGKAWGKVVLLSFAQTSIQYTCFYIGLAHTTGVRASIIQGLAPFVSLLLAAGLYHSEKVTGRKLIGVALGFAGVVLIESAGSGGAGGFSWLGDGLILLSMLSSSLSSVLLSRFTKGEDPFTMSSWQFFIGGLLLTLVGGTGTKVRGERASLFAVGDVGKGVVVLLILAGISAVAYSLWGVLLKHNPVSKVTVFNFLIPVFGTFLSMALLRETASQPLWAILVSLALVAAGTVLVQRSGTPSEKDLTRS